MYRLSKMSEGPFGYAVLRERAYVALFVSNTVTTLGYWLSYFALFSDLTFRADLGPLSVAGLAVVGVLPSVVVGPVAGGLADRLPARTTMVVAEVCGAAVLLVILLTDSLVWTYVGFFGLNTFTELYKPAQKATVRHLFDDELLAEANSLLKTAVSLSRVAGPGVGGALVAAVGVEAVLAVDAVTYAISGGLLWVLLDTQARSTTESGATLLSDLREGARFAARDGGVRSVLVAATVVYGAVGAYNALMPVYVRELLQGGSGLFGVLTAVTACGAVAAGLVVSRVGSAVDDLTAYVLGLGVVGLTVGVVGLVYATPVVLVATLLAGFGFTVVAVFGTNLLQHWAGEEYVGRVIGLYRTGTKGGQAVGMILAGVTATAFGTATTLLVATVLVLSTAVTLLPAVRRSRSREPTAST